VTPADPDATEQDRAFMRLAIQTMRAAGVIERTGGPFGAVVVLNGMIVATAGNRV
jgi:tRNA(Arg) A34 adenosine deaminase TadA